MPRILAIDFGTKRIGAALSDPRGLIASPLEVYESKNPAEDARHYRRLVEEEGVEALVVGLPLHTTGREGASATLARNFGLWLSETTGLRVVFYDERFTSLEADEAMRDSGLKAKGRKLRRDMLAARILLQNYLDAGSPTDEAPARPLDDPPG